ncbi:TIF1B factor, partial [Neopipo cinnamomea]|nr:TIF1B factor [Neopipo cinnamomea]
KVPRVSLERLELGLALDPALPPPAFRVLPGPSAGQFSVIVIEQGGTPQGTAQGSPVPPRCLLCSSSVTSTLPVSASDTCPSPVFPCPIAPSPYPAPPHVPSPVFPSMSPRPLLISSGSPFLSPDWTCLLCQELPPPSEVPPGQGSPPQLSPLDQQRCELVLLELLCHEPCRALQRPHGPVEGGPALDLTLMRAKLQEKLSPPY